VNGIHLKIFKDPLSGHQAPKKPANKIRNEDILNLPFLSNGHLSGDNYFKN